MRYIIIFLTIIVIITLIAINFMSANILQIKTKSNIYNISIEIADSPEEQTLGLMWRDNLPENHGMLFVYDKEAYPSFWMKNMNISLDIFFIGADLKINHIEHNVPPCMVEKCELYSSPVLVQYVLELQSGYAEKYGVEVGDEIIMSEL